MVSRYHDVRAALRDSGTYSAANALAPLQPPCPEAQAVLADGGFRPVPTLTNADRPAHTRARRIADAAFKPRRVAAMEGYVRALVVRFVDERLRSRQADIVRALTWGLPALVVFKILGVPDEDVESVKQGSENRLLLMFGRPDLEQQVEVARGNVAFWRYTEQMVASRRAEPRDDFTSDLVHALDADGQPLTQQEASTVLFGLLLAGHETTTNLLTSAVRRLLEQRSLWEQLCAEPALIPNAVEEVLRYDSPVIAWRRRTKAATTLGGHELPEEANLLLLLGAANRDPEVFADPETIDIRRPNAKDHVSFGSGAHFCLGAPLARLEARVALEELTRRLPSLRLVPGQHYSYLPNVSFRGPRSLQVEWD